jgi:hypothetical protein
MVARALLVLPLLLCFLLADTISASAAVEKQRRGSECSNAP